MDQGGEKEDGDAGVMALNRAPGGPNDEPSCIFFLNQNQGWVSNFNGFLAKSTDGGRTWSDIFKLDDGSQILSYFWNLHFSDSNHGWALSHQGDCYQTMDGGSGWSKMNTGVKATRMFFLRPDFCLLFSKEGLFRITS
ncbi:MAG: WD40/YVTN/BNR-like repeat-containing protein [Blastocatellia bacterium]